MILIKSPGMIIFEIDDTLNITVNDDTVENKVYGINICTYIRDKIHQHQLDDED